MKKMIFTILSVGLLLSGCGSQTPAQPAPNLHKPTIAKQQKRLDQLEADTESTKAAISSLTKETAELKAETADYEAKTKETATASSASSAAKPAASSSQAQPASQAKPAGVTAATLANTAPNQSGEMTVAGNNPQFSAADLSLANGAWERYADLDNLNRAVKAEAMLNQSLMPTQKREPLTWNPTGWHNKRTNHGWLYNRSHLIGFQLSGENNNPKNLMTGTQTLNNPAMLTHEMDIAYYLKANPKHFVRYTVQPVYRGSELVARGVWLRAQSVGDNQVRLNTYIWNVEPGYTIDYATGYSQAQ